MTYNEIERELGLSDASREHVIDAEVVSPKRLKMITTVSLFLSMGAVATTAWFAGQSASTSAALPEQHLAVTAPAVTEQQQAIEAMQTSMNDRDETYKALFEASQDRIAKLEARAAQLESALSALLPVISSAVTDKAPRASAAPSQAAAPVQAAQSKPTSVAKTAQAVVSAPAANPVPTAASLPPPRPPQAPSIVRPPAAQGPSIDETSLPMELVSKKDSGVEFQGSQITDSTGKKVSIGQTAKGFEGKVMRISPSEGLVITDRKIYVIE